MQSEGVHFILLPPSLSGQKHIQQTKFLLMRRRDHACTKNALIGTEPVSGSVAADNHPATLSQSTQPQHVSCQSSSSANQGAVICVQLCGCRATQVQLMGQNHWFLMDSTACWVTRAVVWNPHQLRALDSPAMAR